MNKDDRAHLLINRAPDRGNWILLRAVGANGADAIGATIKLRAGTRELTRDVRAAYSYQSSNDLRVHVGLGDVTEVVDVSVIWEDGTREAFGTFEVNQVVPLVRGKGR